MFLVYVHFLCTFVCPYSEGGILSILFPGEQLAGWRIQELKWTPRETCSLRHLVWFNEYPPTLAHICWLKQMWVRGEGVKQFYVQSVQSAHAGEFTTFLPEVTFNSYFTSASNWFGYLVPITIANQNHQLVGGSWGCRIGQWWKVQILVSNYRLEFWLCHFLAMSLIEVLHLLLPQFPHL